MGFMEVNPLKMSYLNEEIIINYLGSYTRNFYTHTQNNRLTIGLIGRFKCFNLNLNLNLRIHNFIPRIDERYLLQKMILDLPQ